MRLWADAMYPQFLIKPQTLNPLNPETLNPMPSRYRKQPRPLSGKRSRALRQLLLVCRHIHYKATCTTQTQTM